MLEQETMWSEVLSFCLGEICEDEIKDFEGEGEGIELTCTHTY